MKKSEFEHIELLTKSQIDPAKSDFPANLKRAITNWDKAYGQYEKSTDEELRTQWEERLQDRSSSIAEDIKEELASQKKKAGEPKDPKKSKDPKEPKEPKQPNEPNEPKNSKDPHYEKNLAIIDKLYSEGVRTISEEKLEEAGFSCWTYLGFLKGEIGPYEFSSALGDLRWKIYKKKEKAA